MTACWLHSHMFMKVVMVESVFHQESFKTDPTIGSQTSRDKKTKTKTKSKSVSAKLAKPRFEPSSQFSSVHFYQPIALRLFVMAGAK